MATVTVNQARTGAWVKNGTTRETFFGTRAIKELRDDLTRALVDLGEEDPASSGPARARSSDVETSYRAAGLAEPRAKSIRGRLLRSFCRAYLNNGHPQTAEWVCLVTGIDGAWRRVSELKIGGWIRVANEHGEPVLEKTSSGAYAQTYYPTEKALAWYKKEIQNG